MIPQSLICLDCFIVLKRFSRQCVNEVDENDEDDERMWRFLSSIFHVVKLEKKQKHKYE